jgi:hypothetical protein
MATDLREECEELTRLASRGQNPAAKTRLLEALNSKWEGVRVTAARSLVRWGDPDSINAVKLALADLANKPSHWASVRPICEALGPALCLDDLEWVLGLYFEKAKKSNRLAMSHLFVAMPRKEALQAISEWCVRGLAQRRDAESAARSIEWFASEPGRAALAHQSKKVRRKA